MTGNAQLLDIDLAWAKDTAAYTFEVQPAIQADNGEHYSHVQIVACPSIKGLLAIPARPAAQDDRKEFEVAWDPNTPLGYPEVMGVPTNTGLDDVDDVLARLGLRWVKASR